MFIYFSDLTLELPTYSTWFRADVETWVDTASEVAKTKEHSKISADAKSPLKLGNIAILEPAGLGRKDDPRAELKNGHCSAKVSVRSGDSPTLSEVYSP